MKLSQCIYVKMEQPNYPDNTQQCLKIGHCSCAQTWLLSYLKPILCQTGAEIILKKKDPWPLSGAGGWFLFYLYTKVTVWCSDKAVTWAASLKRVITACLPVDKSVSSTRPPGVHTELQQSSDSSYSKHVSRLRMTHSDDSKTSAMCKKITSSACGEVKSNKKRPEDQKSIQVKETQQVYVIFNWENIINA